MPSPTVDIMLIPPIYSDTVSVTPTPSPLPIRAFKHKTSCPPYLFKVSVASDSVVHESRTRDYGLGGFAFFPGEFHEFFAGGVSS
jgi:hypothetical protein